MKLYQSTISKPRLRGRQLSRRGLIIAVFTTSGFGLSAIGLGARQAVLAQDQGQTRKFKLKGVQFEIVPADASEVRATAHGKGGETIIVNQTRRINAHELHMLIDPLHEFVSAEETIRKGMESAVNAEVILGPGSQRDKRVAPKPKKRVRKKPARKPRKKAKPKVNNRKRKPKPKPTRKRLKAKPRRKKARRRAD